MGATADLRCSRLGSAGHSVPEMRYIERNGSGVVEASAPTDCTARVDIDGSGYVTGRAWRPIVRRVAAYCPACAGRAVAAGPSRRR